MLPNVSVEIDDRFKYHKPTEEKAAMHEAVRSDIASISRYFEIQLPDSRERSIAITKLEEAMFWANAAIARNL